MAQSMTPAFCARVGPNAASLPRPACPGLFIARLTTPPHRPLPTPGARCTHQCRASLPLGPWAPRRALASRCIPRAEGGDSRGEKRSASGQTEAEEAPVPEWSRPGASVPPPWAKGEGQRDAPFELPFGLYLIFSVLTAIAAVGSIFEYAAGNPLFGVLPNTSPFWAPILLFFIITGFPTSGFLFFKSVSLFNKFADEEDEENRRKGSGF